MKNVLIKSVIFGAVALAATAQAGPVTCGNPTVSNPRVVTIDDAAACSLVGNGAPTNAAVLNMLGVAASDQHDIERDTRPSTTILGTTVPVGTTWSNSSGNLSVNFDTVTSTEWSLSPSLWGSNQNLWLYVGLYTAGLNPDYFVFQLNHGDTSGQFAGGVFPLAAGPAALWQVGVVGQAPEPGTLALAGLALAGLGVGLRRRKQRQAAT